MSAVQTRGPNEVILDGTDSDVSAEQVETSEQPILRVTIRPVPAELKELFLQIQEKTLVYDGPLAGEEIRAVLDYKSAWLDPNGSLERLVLTGPLPKSRSDRHARRPGSSPSQTASPELP